MEDNETTAILNYGNDDISVFRRLEMNVDVPKKHLRKNASSTEVLH